MSIYYEKEINHIQTGIKCDKASDCQSSNMQCILNNCIIISNCLNSTFGCCSDGYTPAIGKNGLGCPKTCNCHPAGKQNKTSFKPLYLK